MNELKLITGDEAAPVAGSMPSDLSKANPMDALNRRDIEIIKRSLVALHKDNTEVRGAMVALHTRGRAAPSRAFVLTLAIATLVLVGGITAFRPQLESALSGIPMLARSPEGAVNR